MLTIGSFSAELPPATSAPMIRASLEASSSFERASLSSRKSSDHQPKLKRSLLLVHLALNFIVYASMEAYFTTYALLWIDHFQLPKILYAILPIACNILQAFIVDSMRFVEWKIFHTFPYNMTFLVCFRIVLWLIYIPNINLPYYIYLIFHLWELTALYAFIMNEMIARPIIGPDMLSINTSVNIAMVSGQLVGGFCGPFFYASGLFFWQMSSINACMLVVGIIYYFVSLANLEGEHEYDLEAPACEVQSTFPYQRQKANLADANAADSRIL